MIAMFRKRMEPTLPKLPCVVFRGPSNFIYLSIFIFLTSIIIYTSEIGVNTKYILWSLVTLIFIIIYKFLPPRIIETRIDILNVNVKFENGLQEKFLLEEYAFYISMYNEQGSTKSYNYRISLIRYNKQDHKILTRHLIPLRWRVLHPADLSLYVEHIQQQLPQRLEIIFDSKKTATEYHQKSFI